RVIDSDSRQVPYLIERLAEPLSVDVKVEPVEKRPPGLESLTSATVYRLRWPHERLPASVLVLSTTLRIFKRQVIVAIERPVDRRHRDPWLEPLRTVTWAQTDPAQPPVAASVSLPSITAPELL